MEMSFSKDLVYNKKEKANIRFEAIFKTVFHSQLGKPSYDIPIVLEGGLGELVREQDTASALCQSVECHPLCFPGVFEKRNRGRVLSWAEQWMDSC